MKFGTNLLYEKQLGYRASLEKAAKAGFEYLDMDLTHDWGCARKDEEKYFTQLLKIATDNGMKMSQAHAPYVRKITDNPAEFESEEFRERVRAAIRRSAIIGAPYLVAHLYSPYPANYENLPYDYSALREENIKRNLDFCYSLKEDLKEYGVSLAIENVVAYDFVNRMHASCVCCTSEECNRYIDDLGDEQFCVCLDAGHLNLIEGETHAQFIKSLGKRVRVLHLHDNFGRLNDWFGELDRHLPPYLGTLEWEKLAQALKEIGYDGVYSFEVSGYGPTDFAQGNYEYLYKCAKRIFEE